MCRSARYVSCKRFFFTGMAEPVGGPFFIRGSVVPGRRCSRRGRWRTCSGSSTASGRGRRETPPAPTHVAGGPVCSSCSIVLPESYPAISPLDRGQTATSETFPRLPVRACLLVFLAPTNPRLACVRVRETMRHPAFRAAPGAGYHVVAQTRPKSPIGMSSGLFIARCGHAADTPWMVGLPRVQCRL